MHTTDGGDAPSVSEPGGAPDEAVAVSRDKPFERGSARPSGSGSDGRDGATASLSAPPEVVAVAVVAIVAGAVLRFVTASSLWLDEALSVNIAQLPLGDIASWLRHDGHPPLYYLLLHGWTELFGSGDVAVRALSGVFGLLTLPLAWLAGRRRGGPLLGWLTVTVVALSPFAVRYSNEARMYSLVMLLSFAGYLLVDDVLRRNRGDLIRLAGIAVVAALLLYTHYWAIWLVAAAGLMALGRLWCTDDAEVRRGALRVAGALVLGGVLFLPWLPSMLYQSANTGTPWADPMRPTTALGFTLADFGSGNYADAGFFAVLLGLLIALSLFGQGRDNRHIDLDLRTRRQFRYEALVATLTFAIGIVVAYALRGAFATRYASVVFPFLALLVAGGITRFLGRWVRSGVLLALCAILGFGALWNLRDSRTQAGQIAAAVEANARPGDLVVYCPDQLGPAGSRAVDASGADVQQVAYPTYGDPALVDWVDYEERNDAADPAAFAQRVLAESGPERGVFVAWSGDYKTFEGDCEALVNAISASRPGQELVTEDGSRYFEHEYLTWFPPAS